MTKIIIIGAGPGGYEAAIRAAQLDAEVVLIEKDAAGGTCLNRGCIPTKTLWKIAEVYKDLEIRNELGILADNVGLDGVKIRERKDFVVDKVVSGVDFVLGTYPNIERIKGTAKFKDKNTVLIDTEEGEKEVSGDVVLIATGSKVAMPPFEGTDLDNVLTSDSILELETVPKSLVVIGAGVIGME
ncbi:MAG: FAD-dependent oxidoreductase, partial [Gallicola sp.]|nr:FAD-dependent oxidoreductase [Gallicola sp.]